MSDVFGYDKQTYGPDKIASYTTVLLKVDSKEVRLVQNLTLNYQRGVTPVYELGSDAVYMSAGQSSGTLNCGRAVGETKFLEPWKVKDPCATQTIEIGKGTGVCHMDPGTITCNGCLLQSISVTSNAGQMTVSEGANYSVGSVTVS